MITDEYMGAICNTLIPGHLIDLMSLPEGVLEGGGGGVRLFARRIRHLLRTLLHEPVCAK